MPLFFTHHQGSTLAVLSFKFQAKIISESSFLRIFKKNKNQSRICLMTKKVFLEI